MVISRENSAAYWALRVAYGFLPLLAGMDKFSNYLVNWTQYLNPSILQVVPLTAQTFMQAVGVIEIVVGAAILLGASRSFGYIAMLWLFAIAANLFSSGRYYDIALRDIGLGLGAYALGRLTEDRESVVIITETEEYRRAA
jgi:uncharacterized membrane protein YphA (DoxX/SURF4 family)